MNFQEISDSVRLVVDAVREISTAADEHSTSVNEVNGAVVEMTRATEKNAATTEQCGRRSRAQQQAQSLVASFKLEATPLSVVDTSSDAYRRAG